ncbi:MAG: AAA family ATPase, partial [Candidatus Omnitrophota bacterium]
VYILRDNDKVEIYRYEEESKSYKFTDTLSFKRSEHTEQKIVSLKGEGGVLKTETVKFIHHALNLEFFPVSCHSKMDNRDVFWYTTIGKINSLHQWKAVFLINEIKKSRSIVLTQTDIVNINLINDFFSISIQKRKNGNNNADYIPAYQFNAIRLLRELIGSDKDSSLDSALKDIIGKFADSLIGRENTPLKRYLIQRAIFAIETAKARGVTDTDYFINIAEENTYVFNNGTKKNCENSEDDDKQLIKEQLTSVFLLKCNEGIEYYMFISQAI